MDEYEQNELGLWLLDASQRKVAQRLIAECEALLDGDEDRAEAIRADLNRLDKATFAEGAHMLIGTLVFTADDPRELLTRAELRIIDRPDPPAMP